MSQSSYFTLGWWKQLPNTRFGEYGGDNIRWAFIWLWIWLKLLLYKIIHCHCVKSMNFSSTNFVVSDRFYVSYHFITFKHYFLLTIFSMKWIRDVPKHENEEKCEHHFNFCATLTKFTAFFCPPSTWMLTYIHPKPYLITGYVHYVCEIRLQRFSISK